MAEQGNLNQHSSLELLKNDSTANAPERDRLAEAPELDPCVLAPEIVPDIGPQAFSDAYLTALGDQVERQALTDSKGTISGNNPSGVSRKIWIIVGFGLVIRAIGIGLGVGIGIPRRDSSSPTSITTGLMHGIRDDSSIAAVSASDGTRYVFFQDTNGSLRHALYSQTTHSWATDMSLMIPGSIDARNNTPLSATINIASDDSDEIFLFYVAINNSLAARWYVSGQWATIPETDFVNLADFVASPHSRSLSVGMVPDSSSSAFCLFFEELGSNVTALYGLKHIHEDTGTHGITFDALNSPNNPLWTWQNITRNVTSSSTASAWNAPFTTSLDSSSKGPALDAMFYSPRAVASYSSDTTPTNGVLWSVLYNGSFDLNALPSAFLPDDRFPTQDTSAKTDLVKAITYVDKDSVENYMLCVDGTTLINVQLAGLGESKPGNTALSPFPYTRMATTTPAGSRAFYLYHRLNGSILAEEVWDSGRLAWTALNISVAIA